MVVCVFAAYGFAYTVSFYGAVVDASCKVVILPACLSEMKPQLGNREMAEVFACIYAQSVHLCRCDGPHAPKAFHRHSGDEVGGILRGYHAKPVGLAVVRRYFGKKFIV